MVQRIDTHHHAVPEFYRQWLQSQRADAAGTPIPAWTPEASLRQMKLTSVSTAMLSVTTPQVQGGSRTEARTMARQLNTYLHELVVSAPGTFGYFATLPLPDLEGSLDELAFAYDHLTPDGVCLLANYEGAYLGDPFYEPIMAELDRRHAVVFVHPSALPGPAVPGIDPYYADYLLDTVRAALNICRSGTMTRFPNIRFILAHAGGFLPFAAGRLAAAASEKGRPVEGLRLLRRFYFDTALSGTPWSMPALTKFAAKKHVTYGSDFPTAPALATGAVAAYQRFRVHRGSSAIAYEAAQSLFPRLVPVVPPIHVPDGPTFSAIEGDAPRELR